MQHLPSKSIAFTIALLGFASATPVPAFAGSVIHASSYGVKCDGVTDDTVALQSFLSAVTPDSMGLIQPGICQFTNTLIFPSRNTTVLGSGQYSTTLRYAGASSAIDLIQVPGVAGNAAYGTIGRFSLLSTINMTGGFAFNVANESFLNLEGLRIGEQVAPGAPSKLWDGLALNQIDFVRLTGFEIFAENTGLYVAGPGVGPPVLPAFDVYVNGGKIANARTGIHIAGGVDGIQLDNLQVTTNTINVLIDSSSGQKNQEILFGPNASVDLALEHDFIIDDATLDPDYYCSISIQGRVTAAGKGASGSYPGHGIWVKNWHPATAGAQACYISVGSQIIQKNGADGIRVDDPLAVIMVSPTTMISDNGGYGIYASSPSNVAAAGNARNNGTNYSPNVALSHVNGGMPGVLQPPSANASVTAAGANSATATILTSQYNYITGLVSGQGVRLPPLLNTEILVQNAVGGGAVLQVYPPNGAQFGGAGIDIPLPLTTAQTVRTVCTTATQCWLN